MDLANLLQVICSLVLVLALFGLGSLLYKKYVLDKNIIKGGQLRRLKIEEQLYIDSKRRVVLIKKDNTEILLLIGLNGETVINVDGKHGGNATTAAKSSLKKPGLRLKNLYSRKKS